MEELQDAIEDAQYVNAIATQEDGPRPVLPWDKPTEEQLQAFESSDEVHFDDFEWTVRSSAIAFFLFSSFIKTKKASEPDIFEPGDNPAENSIATPTSTINSKVHNNYTRINFCEEVARYRRLQGKPRKEKADQILREFLSLPPPQRLPEVTEANSERSMNEGVHYPSAPMVMESDKLDKFANKTTTANRPSRKYREPAKTEIDEYDLERTVPPWSSNITKAEINKILELNMDWPECKETYVGVKGPVVKDVFKKIDDLREIERQMHRGSSRTNSATGATTTTPVKNSMRSSASSAADSINLDQLKVMSENDKQQSLARVDDINNEISSQSVNRASGYSIASRVSKVSVDDQEDISEIGISADFGPRQELAPASETAVSSAAQGKDSKKTQTEAAGGSSKDSSINIEEDKNGKKDEGVSSKPNRQQVMHESMRNLTKKLRDGIDPKLNGANESVFDEAERVVMESLRREYWADFEKSPEYLKLKHFLWYQHRRVVPDDFFVMRVLGRGGFGLVTACKKGTSGKLYAMKVMNKRRIKMRRAEQLALNERQALAAVESNFVVNLKYSFHSKDDVYLILDLMTGGDLGYHLHQKGRFPKRECQYYAARIMLGLQALHDKNYVYRDLKPENCLLADDGRVRISDLGLATKITPTLHGAAGTRGYWAPEMLKRDKKGRRMPYGHAVDWFSFGCCVAEFISGTNPFRSEVALNFGLERGMQTRERAIDLATREMEPDFSAEIFEPDAADLCRRLLDKNETTRLGASGCEEIMAHPWFRNLNWESIVSDRKRPPFVPAKDVNAASQSEIGTFAEDKAYQETVIEEVDEKVYENWDWTNPRAFAAEVIEFLIYERETGEPLRPMMQHANCCCEIL